MIGVDECGRGALAGPTGVGVCMFTADMPPIPDGVRDSKLMTARKREAAVPLLLDWAPIEVGFSLATEVEETGIVSALQTAAIRAIAALASKHRLDGAIVLLDGSHNWLARAKLTLPVIVRPKADRDCESVAAASVVAKVYRDSVMSDLSLEHPGYGWELNKGYGAPNHYAGLREHGLVPGIHRASWVHL